MEEMLDYILKYPEMIRDSIDSTKNAKLPVYKFEEILVCGMGGSAIGGHILSDVLMEHGIRVDISKRYNLPKYIGSKTLVFIVSYSGNTEETLSQFVDAQKRGLNIIAITSNGHLTGWCEKLGIPFIQLPTGFQPRAALPYLFFPMLEYVQEATDLDFSDGIDETLSILDDFRADRKRKDEIREMASVMKDSRINVYGPENMESAARRIKCQINENSKLPSSWNVFPEMNHNEIVGYEDNFSNEDDYVVFLRENDEHPAVRVRMDTTKSIIQSKCKGIMEIHAEGNSRISKILSLIFMGDILSFRLAKESGKSPIKTDYIVRLKDVLRNELNMQEKLKSEI